MRRATAGRARGSVPVGHGPRHDILTQKQKPVVDASTQTSSSIFLDQKKVGKAACCAMRPQLVAATAPPPSRWTPRAMAAMSFSVPARVGNARGSLSSRRAASAARLPRVRPARGARQGLKVEATVSKDNVFANSPGSLEALNNLTVNTARAGSPPLTSASAPDDFSTIPHREGSRCSRGARIRSFQTCVPFLQTSIHAFFARLDAATPVPRGATPRRVARGDARARIAGISRSIARVLVPPRARVAAQSSADPFSWSSALGSKIRRARRLEMGVRRGRSPPTLTRDAFPFPLRAPATLSNG